jgi:hypothetical protein
MWIKVHLLYPETTQFLMCRSAIPKVVDEVTEVLPEMVVVVAGRINPKCRLKPPPGAPGRVPEEALDEVFGEIPFAEQRPRHIEEVGNGGIKWFEGFV